MSLTISGLSSRQVAAIPLRVLASATEADIDRMTPTSAAGLTSAQLNAIAPALLGTFDSVQLAFLSTKALAGLSAASLGGLSPQQIAGLTTAQKKALTPANIAGLNSSALNALDISTLNTSQLKAVNANALAGADAGQFARLSKASLAVFSAQHTAAMTAQQLARLSKDQIASLSKASISGLTASSVISLSASQVRGISAVAISGLSTSAAAALSAQQLSAVSATSLSTLIVSQPTALSAAQTGALTAGQLNGISRYALQRINVTDLKDEQISALSGTSLAALSATQVSSLLSANAAALSTKQITTFSKAQLTTVNTVGEVNGTRFNLIWDQKAKAAPAGFRAAVIAAAAEMSALFTNRTTVNLQVGFGEINGTPLSARAAASSGSYGSFYSYGTVRGALTSNSSGDAIEGAAFSTLLPSDPTSGGRFFISRAQGKALGLADPTATTLDGFISLSNKLSFQFNGIARPSKYDAIGALEHEITEVMGRTGSAGNVYGANTYTALDLFRYANHGASSVRAITASTPGTPYFSINSGTTNLGTFNAPGNGADLADWSAGEVGDPFGYSMAGLAQKVTPRDVVSMQAIGWHASAAGMSLVDTINAYASV